MVDLAHLSYTTHVRRSARLGLLTGLLVLCVWPQGAAAQRPFVSADPFYRSETARRAFFDNLAVTGELSYRPSGFIQSDGVPAISDDPLALSLRLDYQLARHFDLSGIFDAIGGSGGRSITLSWVVLKYYRYLEDADYAFRLAADPSSDGSSGFPQIDLAFLYTSILSPTLSSDFALGVRKVNLAYGQLAPAEESTFPDGGRFVYRPRDFDIIFTRALGTELHLMMNYNAHFDPAGSNVFLTILAEGGRYSLFESTLGENEVSPGVVGNSSLSTQAIQDLAEEEPETETDYRGGVLWLRAGFEFSRPSYQVSPYVSAPVKQWMPSGGEWPESRFHVGVRLMLR